MSQRRRKKPSSRPGGGALALKLALGGGALCLALFFVLLFAAVSWITGYRESEAFRAWTAARAAAFLRSEIDLSPLEWSDSTVYAARFRARGHQDAVLARLEIDGARARFAKPRDGAWQVPEASASQLSAEFSPDRLPGPWPSPAGPAGVPAAGSGLPAWLRPYVPQRFAFGEIRVDAASVRVAGQDGAETFALRGAPAVFRPGSGGGWEISGRGGRLILPGQPELAAREFRLRWQGQEIFLNEAELDFHGSARLSARGAVSLGPGFPLDLDLRFSGLDVKRAAAPAWRDKLSGVLRGHVELTGSAADPGGLRQRGSVQLEEGLLSGLPLLGEVARYTRSERFRRLALSQAEADFDRQGERLEITRLALQSDGLCRLEGSLLVEGEALGGDLRLGVAPGVLSWIPGAERKVFAHAEGGFLWTDLRLAGTVDDPREDLTRRLLVAAGETLIEEAPARAAEAAREAVRDPASVIDQGKRILDTLSPLFR